MESGTKSAKRRASKRLTARLVGAATATVLALTAVPLAASATPSVRDVTPTASVKTDLTAAFAKARGLDASSISGIRRGTTHVATNSASGTSWATAWFEPAKSAPRKAVTQFQDGAGIGIFKRHGNSTWRLVGLGGEPFPCSGVIPDDVQSAWNMTTPAGCRAGNTVASQKAKAAKAMHAMKKSLKARPAVAPSIPAKIAKIALAQVGVQDTPVTHTFSFNCDPYTPMDGPTIPNSDGCGFDKTFGVKNQNETWCADFVKWVWKRAGVTKDLNSINAGAVSVYQWGINRGQDMPVDPQNPEVGDAVVFFGHGQVSTQNADHVGIISAVHPDGTIDMVNGDFMGPDNISVHYNTHINLSTWASNVWSEGEQWVFVTPPQHTKAPAPTIKQSGPKSAVVGTAEKFHASATMPNGKRSSFVWSFGDGGSARGANPTHVFRNAGWQTVTVTATSRKNTVATKHYSINVLSSSSAAVSTADGAHYYTTQPVQNQLFLRDADGNLVQEYSDGGSYSAVTLPGSPAKNPGITALNYATAGTNWAMHQHVYFRGTDGKLHETAGSGKAASGWDTETIPGKPATAGPIVAALQQAGTSQTPSVYFQNAAGRLQQTTSDGSTWTTSRVPGNPADSTPLAVQNYIVKGKSRTGLFYLNAAGKIAVNVGNGRSWSSHVLTGKFTPAANSSLAVTAFGKNGKKLHVFFMDKNDRIAQAVWNPANGKVRMSQLPGKPKSGTPIMTANYLSTAGKLWMNVFFLQANGDPVDTHSNARGRRWLTNTLWGTATQLLGVTSYPDAVQGQHLYMANGETLYDNQFTPVNQTWWAAPLPGTAG